MQIHKNVQLSSLYLGLICSQMVHRWLLLFGRGGGIGEIKGSLKNMLFGMTEEKIRLIYLLCSDAVLELQGYLESVTGRSHALHAMLKSLVSLHFLVIWSFPA